MEITFIPLKQYKFIIAQKKAIQMRNVYIHKDKVNKKLLLLNWKAVR